MIKIRKIISVIPFPSYSELIGNLYVAKLSIPHACFSVFVGAHTLNYQMPRLGFLTSRSIYKSLYGLKKISPVGRPVRDQASASHEYRRWAIKKLRVDQRRRKGWIVLDQIRTIDRQRITKKLDKLTDKDI